MEAQSAAAPRGARLPGWLAGLLPLLLLGVAIGLFVALDAPGLGDRPGVPVEELAVERTVLRPGEIELHVRNDGPDPVAVRQVIVNDGFAAFSQSSDELGRLGGDTIRVAVPVGGGRGLRAQAAHRHRGDRRAHRSTPRPRGPTAAPASWA